MRPATSLLGRDQDLSGLNRLVRPGQLVSLLGPPGVGKTRLARELAVRLTFEHPPAWLSVSAGDHTATLAAKLATQVRLAPGAALLDALTRQLALAPRLIVIDGCEWSLAAARDLVDTLLTAVAKLTVVATSREPLGVEAEVQYRVAPLHSAAAVELFNDRAARVRASEDLPDLNEVAEVCDLLDRLPLGIELVAARLAFTPWRVLRSECRRGSLSEPLRGAIKASYDRLEPSAAAAFRRMAVFSGVIDENGVIAVAAAGDRSLAAVSLATLSSASLLRVDAFGWDMLDTIKEFALERLRDAGEETETRRAHAEYCLEIALGAKAELVSNRQVVTAQQLERHGADIEAAIQWSRDAAPDLLVQIVCGLRTWWLLRADLDSGTRLLREAADSKTATLAASASLGLLRLSLEAGLLQEAREEGRRAAAIYAAVGDPGRRRRSTVGLAWATALLGELDGAREDLQASFDEARATRDLRGIYDAGWCLGQVEWRLGNNAEAARVLQMALQAATEIGAHQLIAHAEDASGHLAMASGHPDAARRYFQRSHSAAREFASAGLQVHALDNLARVELGSGDQERARSFLVEALALATDRGVAPHRLASLLEVFAWLASRDHQPRRAIRLWHAAAAVRRQSRSDTFELWASSAGSPKWLDAALREVGSRAAECSAEGVAMSAAEAVALARRTGRGIRDANHLTAREAEIAVLVSHGLTNRLIAERLGLSPRTVDSHLEHVRGKLGLGSKTEVAAWAATRRAAD